MLREALAMRRQQPRELALRCHQQPLESPGVLGLAQVIARLPDELIRDQLMQAAGGYKSRGSAPPCSFCCHPAGRGFGGAGEVRARAELDAGTAWRGRHTQVLFLYRTIAGGKAPGVTVVPVLGGGL